MNKQNIIIVIGGGGGGRSKKSVIKKVSSLSRGWVVKFPMNSIKWQIIIIIITEFRRWDLFYNLLSTTFLSQVNNFCSNLTIIIIIIELFFFSFFVLIVRWIEYNDTIIIIIIILKFWQVISLLKLQKKRLEISILHNNGFFWGIEFFQL